MFERKTGELETSRIERKRNRSAAPPGSIQESLERSATAQSQLQLGRALNQRPSVVAQAKLAHTLTQRMYQGEGGGEDQDLEEKLRAGIAARYPEIDPELLGHVVKAKLTLMNRGYSEAKLLELQGEMGDGLDLDTVLSHAEAAQDFGPRQVVDKLLDRDSFQGILRSKSQIFDLGTPSDHGPHTHRMQWYVLYKAFQEGRLKKKPVELYEALGRGELKDSKDEIRTLWDDVFDFDNAAAGLIGGGEEDEARERAAYSSPEWMLSHLARADGPLQGGRLQQQLAGDRQIMRQLGGGALQDMKGALVQKIFWKEMARGLPENEATGRLAILEDLDIPALKEIFKGLGGVLP